MLVEGRSEVSTRSACRESDGDRIYLSPLFCGELQDFQVLCISYIECKGLRGYIPQWLNHLSLGRQSRW